MSVRSTVATIAVLIAFVTACSTEGDTGSAFLPATTAGEMSAVLAASEQPVVLNVWASWCIPCRSEAPLFRTAARNAGDRVTFIGVAVNDQEGEAVEFLNEFDLWGFDHYLDRPGAVPAALGGRGVPLTFFFDGGGYMVALHSGIIDERTLALQIDELLRRAG